MAKNENSLDVEIFAIGQWNGMTFEAEDLRGMAAAFHSLMEVHKVPLKFGHNDDQPMTDGQPAIGWVDDVWYDEQTKKLMGSFSNIPDVVFESMEKKLYRHVSVELDMGVEHKGQYYSWVLSGVALLGADIPAVNTLAELSAYMGRDDGLQFKKRLSFTAINMGGDDMPTPEQLQAEIDSLKAKNATLETDKASFSKKVDTMEAEANQRDTDDLKAKFATDKAAVTAKLDDMVKAGKINPAQREKFMAGLDDDAAIERVNFSIEVIGAGAANAGMDTDEHGREGDNHDEGKTPDMIIVSRAKGLMAKNSSLSFMAAKNHVLDTDRDLANEYRDMNGTM